MNEDEFYLNVAHALSGCQLVEQQLKLYISGRGTEVRVRVPFVAAETLEATT